MDHEQEAATTKLDLHTHCGEGINRDTPTDETVREVVTAVRAKGLEGIGITEPYNKAWGFKVEQIVDSRFAGEIVIIPVQETHKGRLHLAELYLPGDLTFRFLVHPGRPQTDLCSEIDDTIHGVELRNPTYDYQKDEITMREAAEKHNLLILQNSDAHCLSDLG